MATAILNVPDILCEYCERTVTNALAPLPGVRGVSVEVPAKQVRVSYDPKLISLDRMKAVLEKEEYPVASVEAAP